MALPYFAAFLIAEVVFAIFFFLIPETLGSTTSSVVGEPAFLNFNVNRRFVLFYLQAIGVPALTIWLTRRTPLPRISVKDLSPLPTLHGERVLKTFFLGLVLSLGTVKFPNLISESFLYQALFFATVYTLGVQFLFPKANIWISPLSLFLPTIVAGTSRIHSPAGAMPLPDWFPLWLSVLLVGASYAVLWRHRRDPKLEGKALLYLVFPVLIFVLSAQIRYIATQMDYTHDGEFLVSGHLFSQGLFPWRDFNLVRGILGECLRPWVGFKIFGNSVWGERAGDSLILVPLLLVFRYFFALYVSRGNLFLLLVAVRVFQAPTVHIFSVQYFSMVFQPLLWICFFEVLRRGSNAWAYFFASMVFLNAAVSLEGLTTVVATSAILLCWRRALFWRTSVVYFVGAVIGFAFLAYHHALWPFLQDFESLVAGRKYATGYPFRWLPGWPFKLAVFIPLLCVFYVVARLYLKAKRKEKFDSWDLGMAGIGVYLLLSYQKFLCSPDWHIYEVTSECLPIFLWAISDYLRRPVVCFAASVLVFATYPFSIEDRMQEFTRQFHRTIDGPSSVERLGLVGITPHEEKNVRAFQTAFAGRLGPNDTVYDFSNSKGLFYYLLDLKPVGRYVYTGFTLTAQRNVIEAMKAHPPKLVIYSGGPFWEMGGVPNSVRFREISEFLLRHYEPMVAMQGYIVLQRKPENVVSSTTLYTFVPPCNWGFVPYVSRSPREKTGTTAEPFVEVGNIGSIRYLDLDFDELTDGSFSVSDKPQADGSEQILFKTAAGGPATLRIQVSSCPQWYQFKSRKFYLHGKGGKLARMTVIAGPGPAMTKE